MGIRFHCHHCERLLNVKASQAGLTGICPSCRKPVLIVSESELESEEAKSTSGSSYVGMYEDDEQITDEGFQSSLKSLEGENQGEPEPSNGRTAKRFRGSYTEEAKDAFLLDKPELSPLVGVIDPIAENPKLVWYYRTKEVGERGPLKAAQMQTEVDSGRVGVGSVVWREDWEMWLPAERVFPQLRSLDGQSVDSGTSKIGFLSELKNGKKKALALFVTAIILALAVITLLVILIKWLFQ